ncbi:MAG: sigma-70 family RNA polymerase sigma factor [Actinomycetota bacterium]|nr:sigma-70 family RNA polymerase sigma factor [Actinomycetota bacterium]
MLTDDVRELVARAGAHDPDAWEQLYRWTYPRLFAYARRRVPSDHAADDVVSETMVRALDKLPSFTWQGAGFDAWVFGICRNVVLEQHRRRGREQPHDDVDPSPGREPGPLDELVASEERDVLRAAFARLSPADREVLELRVVAGLSAEGAAEVLGRGPGAIRMAQSRALRRLESLLEEVNRGR